ncbi:MAG: antibiotic biosynthesis monooxygenase [Spirochaetia bacterium]|nr:antibiotic biosynthesis monooxygenase [Spirochaetia bacterium]
MPIKKYMYSVIFKAVVKKKDNEYLETAKSLRNLAVLKYGCIDIFSLSENNTQVTISYWSSLEDIKNWKNDPEHVIAQNKVNKWYQSYKIEIVKIIREYDSKRELK